MSIASRKNTAIDVSEKYFSYIPKKGWKCRRLDGCPDLYRES